MTIKELVAKIEELDCELEFLEYDMNEAVELDYGITDEEYERYDDTLEEINYYMGELEKEWRKDPKSVPGEYAQEFECRARTLEMAWRATA